MWVDDPAGAPWEIYTVKDDAETPAGELAPSSRAGRWTTRVLRPTAPDRRRRPPAAETSLLARRLAAESLGTGVLVAAVVGSGIMAEPASPTTSASSCS